MSLLVKSEADVCIVNVLANMTKFYANFNEWYWEQVRAQLDDDNVQAGLRLSRLKPVHVGWLVEFYNHVIASKGKEIIDS